ncbi:hypothetical protein LIER_42409 [Lithospermum erythrorhizon]|uniref:Uncharacterized protein n=1 Tax=Lithospermum erythrorhizon TaxID=34254 RepID=A0AAV3RR52_LITER
MSANRMFTIFSEMHKDKGMEDFLQITMTDLTSLWHYRLHTLQSKKMVKGLPEFKNESFTCVEGLNGKQTRVAMAKQSNWRESKNLELIHSDLCGLISPTLNSRKMLKV